MDALLLPFLAAFLAEFGDKTQLLAVMMAARFRAPGIVLGAVALAALANMALGAAGGAMLHALINFRAATLMLALALASAGAGALWRQKPPELSSYGRVGLFLTCFLGFLILEFGDKTQFVTMTLAARTGSLWLTALGAAGGVALANAPAIALAGQWPRAVPLGAIRIGVGCLFLLLAAMAALSALRLV